MLQLGGDRPVAWPGGPETRKAFAVRKGLGGVRTGQLIGFHFVFGEIASSQVVLDLFGVTPFLSPPKRSKCLNPLYSGVTFYERAAPLCSFSAESPGFSALGVPSPVTDPMSCAQTKISAPAVRWRQVRKAGHGKNPIPTRAVACRF